MNIVVCVIHTTMSRRSYKEILPLIEDWSSIERTIMYHLSLENDDIFNLILLHLKRLQFTTWRSTLHCSLKELDQLWIQGSYRIYNSNNTKSKHKSIFLVRVGKDPPTDLHFDFAGMMAGHRLLERKLPTRPANVDELSPFSPLFIFNFIIAKRVGLLPLNY